MKTSGAVMMSAAPVEAAHGGVRQAGVTGAVNAVDVGFELSGAATAACVGDVPAQRRHDTV